MRSGRLEILKLEQLSIDEYINECQKNGKCNLCNSEFTIGDDFLYHAMKEHGSWVHFKLLQFQVMQGKLKKLADNNYLNPLGMQLKEIMKPYSIYGDREQTGEPNSPEFEDQLFQPPRCKKCNHKDPNYDVASSPPHKDGIKLKCVHCGDISVKD